MYIIRSAIPSPWHVILSSEITAPSIFCWLYSSSVIRNSASMRSLYDVFAPQNSFHYHPNIISYTSPVPLPTSIFRHPSTIHIKIDIVPQIGVFSDYRLSLSRPPMIPRLPSGCFNLHPRIFNRHASMSEKPLLLHRNAVQPPCIRCSGRIEIS